MILPHSDISRFDLGEIKEMVDLYEAKGISHEDAVQVVTTLAKYKDFYVDLMMAQELGLQVPETNYISESMREGMIMFCSFAFFGALPLLGYVLIPLFAPNLPSNDLFAAACIVTGLVLFFMGTVKAKFSANHWFWTGSETLLLGGACATVAFTVGQLVNNLAGGDSEL